MAKSSKDTLSYLFENGETVQNEKYEPKYKQANQNLKYSKLVILVSILITVLNAVLLLNLNVLYKKQGDIGATSLQDTHGAITQPNSESKVTKAATTGRIVPLKSAKIFPAGGGYVKNVLVSEGEQVLKGDVLATIENPEIISTLNAKQLHLERSMIEVKRINSQIQFNEKELERLNQLKISDVITDREIDESIHNLKLLKYNELLLQNEKRVIENEIILIKEQQGYLNLTAPFNGIVASVSIAEGDRYDIFSGNSIYPNGLMAVTDKNLLFVEINLPVKSYERLSSESTFSAVYRGKEYLLALHRESDEVSLNGTVKIKLKFVQETPNVLINQKIDVNFEFGE